MTTYSAFLTLPLHISEKIACYIFGHPDSCCPVFNNKVENKQTLPTLCEISQLWRDIALRHACRLIQLFLYAENSKCGWAFPDTCTSVEVYNIDMLQYVENIRININRECLLDADFGLQLLLNTWPSSHVFPLARRVKIHYIDGQRKYNANSADAEVEVITAIVNRISRLVPKLQEVCLEYDINKDYEGNRRYWLNLASIMDGTLTLILPKAKRLNFHRFSLWAAKSPAYMYGAVGLTHLKICSGNRTDIYKHIIRRNALSLNTLIIFDLDLRNIAWDLTFGDDNEAVTYPRLERLELSYYHEDGYILAQKIDSSIVLFPALKRLCWDGPYPFIDDTPFRGNNSTLAYLSMEANEAFIRIAQKYKIFYEGSHPRLRNIVSTLYYDKATWEYLDMKQYLQFTFGRISPVTQTLKLDTYDHGPMLLQTIPQYPHMTNIQALKIPQVCLMLSDIIDLLKLLPILTFLKCGFRGLGANVTKIDYNSLPEQLYSLHYPLSNYFSCFYMPSHGYQYKDFVLSTIILAIICPRFTFAQLNKDYSVRYYTDLKNILAAKPFSDYAGRVQHLFKD
ncbi:hypothetical protein BX070DRAFT_219947 [Coemansia spiralis]|nr:hypothetical protein BX070DRAFT_219947 [Coemansia spiralis]